MNPKPSRVAIDKIPMAEWSHLKTDFMWVYEARVDPRYRNLQEHFPGQSAFLLRKGTVQIENEQGSVTAKAGQWIFPKQGKRWQRFSVDARILSLHFNLQWPGGRPLFDWDTALVFDAVVAPRLEAQLDRLRRRVERQFPGVTNRLPWSTANLSTHLWIQHHFSAWIQTYARTLLNLGLVPSRLGLTDPRILEAIHKLDRHPIDAPFREADLAREVGLSVSQLDRLFSKQFGHTPSQYLDRLRLRAATTLIYSGSLSIKHVCYKVGFNSLPYFSRWFRNRTGLSPREYQKQDQEERGRTPFSTD